MLDESRFSFLPRKPSTLTAAPSDVATRMTARPLAMRSQAQSTVVVPGGRQVADTQKMAQSVAVVDDHDHDHDHSSSERHRKLEAARRRLQQFKEERHAGAVVVVDDLNAAGQMASSSPLDGGTLGELVARCRQYESHIHALQGGHWAHGRRAIRCK